MMFFEKIIRTIVYAKILIDTFTLNIGIVPIKLNSGISEILGCYSITAKCNATLRILLLQFLKIGLIQNKSF